ncbi:DUF3291 domain-containing protein [Sorangium sp. So ce1182]
MRPEAEERVEHLRRRGPTPHAFTFRQLSPAGRRARA